MCHEIFLGCQAINASNFHGSDGLGLVIQPLEPGFVLDSNNRDEVLNSGM
jgi:hypothetical protein